LETGANKLSLVTAQINYQRIGVSDPRRQARARPATPADHVEAGWRPVDLLVDDFEEPHVQDAEWPIDPAVLYWWRSTFWRAAPGGARSGN
jgi:hypothetical protein